MIDFGAIFEDIKTNYKEYKSLPKVYGSLIGNKPSIIKTIGECTIKIFNTAFGGLYVSVKTPNVWSTIEMYESSNLKNFYCVEYEGEEEYEIIKYSIGASPHLKIIDGETYKYLTIRYLSDKFRYDFDDIRIGLDELINYTKILQNNEIPSLIMNGLFSVS